MSHQEGFDEQTSVLLIQALADVWKSIRDRHSAVPGVVLLAAPAQRGGLNVLGHFAALRWSARKKEGSHFHEVVVVAEHLDRPAEEIVATLIHEAAHAMNFAAGIFDCSASQYHNKRFKEAAQELGLIVEKTFHYGFAYTTLSASSAVLYRPEIEALQRVLVHRRRPMSPRPGPPDDGSEDGDAKPGSRSRKATCACDPPFIIRVSLKTLRDTVIRCESCGEPFRIV